jgi:AcrR family transcriptional regulator
MSTPRAPVRRYGGVSAEERIAARRARLLDAALELFGTAGYEATGVKDVCRAAGVTDRYFYESFRDSRELFVTLHDEATDELFTAVAGAVATVPPVADAQLHAAIGTFVGALADDPRKPRVIFSEPAAAGVEADRHMRATLRRFAALVAATARPHLPLSVSDDLVSVLSLSLVGTLERVIVDWQDGALDLPVDRIVDHCATLFQATLTGLLTADRERPGGR